MRKKKIWRWLLATGSFVVLAGGTVRLTSFANDTVLGVPSFSVSGQEECRRLLMELVSGSQEPGRHEIYVTGEEFEPDSLVIAQMFPEAVNISNTKVKEDSRNGKTYITCRIGFEQRSGEEGCVHRWEQEVSEPPGCRTLGHGRLVCQDCGYEKEEILSPLGHKDMDGNSLCDRCGERSFPQKKGDSIFVIYDSGGIRRTLDFECLREAYGGGMLYGYKERIPTETVLEAVGKLDGTEAERVEWWLRNDFLNGISVRSACLGAVFLDEDGNPLPEESWVGEQELRPGIILKTPETGAETERTRWSVGDVQVRELGGRTYRFYCVDEDYTDTNSYYQSCALFLCGTVIRSDVDSTDSERTILPFGKTNHYKNSDIRKWLAERAAETGEDILPVFTVVNSAFEGRTGDYVYSQMDLDGFIRHPLPFQGALDRMFLLSVEEAFRYREELWEADGAGSAYSRGYWLRTPVFSADEEGGFTDGDMAYAVDLEQGCLRPAKVTDTSFGIRPAFCLLQE